MRPIEDIKADIRKNGFNIENAEKINDAEVSLIVKEFWKVKNLEHKKELLKTIIGGIPLYRLEEICQAERNGLCVALPCKVGTHLWIDGREAIVSEFFGYETERCLKAQYFDNGKYIDIPFEEIGTSVFLAPTPSKNKTIL